MKTKILMVSLLIAFTSCKKKATLSDVSTTQSNSQAELTEKINDLVQEYVKLDIFSGIVLVAEKGDISFHKAYGLSNREKNIPNSVNTLFDIGSMNKTFTSIVIKQLAEEGKIDLNDNLTKFLSGFKDPNTNKITINHLLDHESGFGDYHTSGYFDLPLNERKLGAIVERAKSYQLNFEPGTEQDYSNLGYVILGAVIEKVTGKSYFDNVQERIVTPLNLKNTYLNDFDNLETRIAIGYYYTPLGILVENKPIQDTPNPDGGFLSTTEDILKFYRSYYYDDILLSKKFKSSDPFFKYLNELPEGKAVGAAGGFEGFNTALFQVYSDDLTIIVFANMDEPVAENIASNILKLYRGETPDKPQLPAIQNIRKNYEEHGIDYIKENFQELTINFHPSDPKDIILNNLGYAYLYEAKDNKKALDIFKLNTELFPNIANCWDSLGEALAMSKNKSEAIKAYKKALELNPDMDTALQALQKLTKE